VWDRLKHTLSATTASAIEALLVELRAAADGEDLPAAANAATQLRAQLAP
jgi:hypothetical protein